MTTQRACGAEMQVGNKLSNGPLRAQSNGYSGVFCDVQADVTCRGYVGIPLSARGFVKQGGTADRLTVRP